ncbi:hypothetical protein BDB00DRAFT_851566 [Zychaea mexicana]|uniref:uncharacterized protein n=1 Tax=Zychaea mexicana TaxID=64656 RepID=UPI0022FE6ABF|nr:uncharacterized protein BDB00DRAFT_851566 [Zychaea mexicana]KAI9485112.1 hypothetical protein BDB00DRAFT_851566 [Zychaea mexicana]
MTLRLYKIYPCLNKQDTKEEYSDYMTNLSSQHNYPLDSTVMESYPTSKTYSSMDSCRITVTAPATTMASTTMPTAATFSSVVDGNAGKERGKKELHVIKDPTTTTMKFKPAEILPKQPSAEDKKMRLDSHYYNPMNEPRPTSSFPMLPPPIPSSPESESSLYSSSTSSSSTSSPSTSSVSSSSSILEKKQWPEYQTDKFSRQHNQRFNVLRRIRTTPVSALASSPVASQCTKCDQYFTRHRDMQRHIKSVHQEKQYQCSCDCKFTRLDSLKRHQRKKACNNLRLLSLSSSSSSPLKSSSTHIVNMPRTP